MGVFSVCLFVCFLFLPNLRLGASLSVLDFYKLKERLGKSTSDPGSQSLISPFFNFFFI